MKFFRPFLLLVLNLCSIIIVVQACKFVGEQYFFDRLYYAKSPTFGYTDHLWNPLENTKNIPSIEKRIETLRTIFPKEGQTFKKEVLKCRDPKKFNVVMIGDSVLYGNGVKHNFRVSEFLEQKLQTVTDSEVCVLAQSGDSIIENYFKYLKANEVLQPDLYIFGMVNNDFIMDIPNKYPGQELVYEQLRESCPLQEKTVNWESGNIEGDEAMVKIFGPSVDEQYANLCYLKTIAKNLKKEPVLFYSFTPLYEETIEASESAGYYSWKIMDVYKKSLEEQDIKVVSPLNIEDFMFKPVSQMEDHPSVKTHQLYAESIFKEISTNERWNTHFK
jgi:hypothetical protein